MGGFIGVAAWIICDLWAPCWLWEGCETERRRLRRGRKVGWASNCYTCCGSSNAADKHLRTHPRTSKHPRIHTHTLIDSHTHAVKHAAELAQCVKCHISVALINSLKCFNAPAGIIKCSGTGKQQIYSHPPLPSFSTSCLPSRISFTWFEHIHPPTLYPIPAAATLIQLSLTNTRQIPLESRIANMFGLNFICIDSPMHSGQQGVTLERSWLIANGAKKWSHLHELKVRREGGREWSERSVVCAGKEEE